jgi:hypothetical protein
VEDAVKEIEKLGIPKQEVRTLEEPGTFPVKGVMSFTRLDFEVELKHALNEIGATESEEEAYIRGLRKWGRLGVGQHINDLPVTSPHGSDFSAIRRFL